VAAFLDDYACLNSGLLRLGAATGEVRWQREAVRLQAEQERRLGDPEAGGYFTAGEDPRVLYRAKPAYDGAMPSGNGVAVLNLLELFGLTGEAGYRERAEAALGAFGEGTSAAPLAHVTLLRAVPGLSVPAPKREAAAPAPLEEDARDVVEVVGRLVSGGEGWRAFTIELKIRNGWHVNANPAGADLVPTKVAPVLGGLRGVSYPEGEPFGAPPNEVPVYRGRVRLTGEIAPPGGGAPAVELTYQACDATRCLPSLTRLVRLQ
jgi:hypothetical protein